MTPGELPAGQLAPGETSVAIRVVLVDDGPRTVDNLAKLLSFEEDIQVVGSALSAAGGIETVRRIQPDVLVMDVNLPDMDGIRATEQMSAELPLVPVILISVQEDREYLRRAMRAGARQYLVKPFGADELVDAIRRVHQMEQLKRQVGTAPPPPPDDEGPADGNVIVFYSGKGGVGKSTIAINTAAALAKETGQEVALVDLDLQYGDVAVMLGLEPQGTISDVAQAYPNIDGPFLGALMPEANQVRVLAAPLSPEMGDLVTPEHVRACLSMLKQVFDWVVVDMSQHLNDVALEAVELADHVFLITDLNLPAIKDAKLAFRLFEHLGVPRERVLLVLNRADAPSDITVQHLEANLRFPVGVSVPSQGKIVVKSIQSTVPFVVSDPDSEIALSIRELVGTLVPLADANRAGGRKQRRRLFARSSDS